MDTLLTEGPCDAAKRMLHGFFRADHQGGVSVAMANQPFTLERLLPTFPLLGGKNCMRIFTSLPARGPGDNLQAYTSVLRE